MSFFGKIKQMAGIGGVKVQLRPENTTIADFGGQISGIVQLTAKSDQLVAKLTVSLTEKWTVGTGENRKSHQFDLGKYIVVTDLAVKAGETKDVPFTLNYSAQAKSRNDQLASQGGVMGALGKVGKFLDAEKSKFFLHSVASVKGTILDASDEVQMTIG